MVALTTLSCHSLEGLTSNHLAVAYYLWQQHQPIQPNCSAPEYPVHASTEGLKTETVHGRQRLCPRSSRCPITTTSQAPWSFKNRVHQRKKKCGEERPTCSNCIKSGVQCEGYPLKAIWKPARVSQQLRQDIFEPKPVDAEVVERSSGVAVNSSTPEAGAREQILEQLPLFRAAGAQTQIRSEIHSEARFYGQIQAQNLGCTECGRGPRWKWLPCYTLILIDALAILSSLTLALWWSITRNDVSGGFTMAAYIVAVFGVPLGCLQIMHNKRCRCWGGSDGEG
ncbi:hypothetical protein B0J14DRAFT_556139 [Halenospora varia]|nr:hypothetical protein B0J14DRAFT_556139 [Halenospora varia]